MPQLYNDAVITDAGVRLLNKAQAGGAQMQFTRIAVGNGIYTAQEKELSALHKSTGLKSEKNSYALSSVEIVSDSSVRVAAIITNRDPATGEVLVDEGYYINEMGLFAQEKDDSSTEVLYSIVTTSADNGDFMPAYNGFNPAQIVQEYYAAISNAADITIRVASAGAALLLEDAQKKFNWIDEEIAKLKQGTADVMTGATASAAGRSGLAPAPAAGAANRYLRSDGLWKALTPEDIAEIMGFYIQCGSESVSVEAGNKKTISVERPAAAVNSSMFVANAYAELLERSGSSTLYTQKSGWSVSISHNMYISNPRASFVVSNNNSTAGTAELKYTILWHE